MKKKMYRIVLSLLVLISLISFKYTYAADDDGCESTSCDYGDIEFSGDLSDECKNMFKTNVMERYGIKGTYDTDAGKLVLSIGSVNSAVDKDNLQFSVKKIRYCTRNGESDCHDVNDGRTLEKGSNLVINDPITHSELIGFTVYLTASSKSDEEPFDEDFTKNCGDGSELTLKYTVEIGGDPIEVEVPSQFSADDGEISFGYTPIDCDTNAYDADTFEGQFCDTRNKALTIGINKGDIGSADKIDLTEDEALQCDYKLDESSKPSYIENESNPDISDEDYYVNKQYLYAEKVEEISDTYTYHYGCSGSEGAQETVSCKIRCEEAVLVEYGPPVASTAGLCFEYKVRVTSRVNCRSEGSIKPPSSPSICVPTPICTNGSPSIHHQGGPSEDFDNCVNKCDGGVYSDKCSSKCYKKVYGKSLTRKTSGNELVFTDKLNEISDTVTAENVSNNLSYTHNGTSYSGVGYTCDGDSITWVSGANGENRLEHNDVSSDKKGTSLTYDSIWHWIHPWGISGSTSYALYSETGIPRRASCGENCYWSGCKGNVYLPDTLTGNTVSSSQKVADDEHNKTVFENLKEECQSKASCSTKTGEFTISAQTNDTWIDFPWSSSGGETDKIGFNNGEVNPNTSSSGNTTLISTDGCYDDAVKTNLYEAEWTFPGTWINKKNGSISYEPKTLNSWRAHNKKFCIPKNTKNVNAKWWTYYYKVMHGDDDSYAINDDDYQSNFEMESGDSCSDRLEHCATDYHDVEFTQDDADNPDWLNWNLKAHTENFGYLNWNIDISCFYAVNDTPTNYCDNNGNNCSCPENNTDESSDPCVDDKPVYRVRTVDLQKLFPNKDGTGEREPGLNWTEYANNDKAQYVTSNDVKESTIESSGGSKTIHTVEAENYDARDYTQKPSLYKDEVERLGTSIYGEDYLDYQVVLSRHDIKTIKSQNYAYGKFENGKMRSNGDVPIHSYYSTFLRTPGNVTGAILPSVSVLHCNNIQNHDSTTCYLTEG